MLALFLYYSFPFIYSHLKLVYSACFSVQVWYWHLGFCPLGNYCFIPLFWLLWQSPSLSPSFEKINLAKAESLPLPCLDSFSSLHNFCFLLFRVQNAEVLCLGLVSVAVFMLVMPLFKATGGILLQMAPPSIPTSALSKCWRQVILILIVYWFLVKWKTFFIEVYYFFLFIYLFIFF